MINLNHITIAILFLGVLSLGSNVVNAACSPGIPCTGYDIYTNTDAGTSTTYSGSKTGTPAPHANVTGTTTSACDGNFMNQIYSRAWLEGSREVIMSEQLIHKPDSVLEYTCFDQFVNIAAHNAGEAFSESQKWKSVELELWTAGIHKDSDATLNDRGNHDHGSCSDGETCPDKSEKVKINDTGTNSLPDQTDYSVFSDERLDNILSELLFDNLQDYVDDNFDHTFMGESTTIDNNINASSIGSNSYLCSHMETIWNISKCIDFGEDDRFRSFEHLVNFDPRSIPKSCSPGKESDDSIEAGDDDTKYENISSGGGKLSAMPIDLAVSDISGVNMDLDPVNKCPPAGGKVAGVNTDFSNDIIRIANNCDHETDDDKLNIYSSFDIMETYTDIIKGFGIYIPGTGNETGVILCSSPLPTGVPVITYNITNSISGGIDTMERTYAFHFEHICPNAGCYYQPVKLPYIWGAPIPSSVSVGVCLPVL